jgi:hypothetical protein
MDAQQIAHVEDMRKLFSGSEVARALEDQAAEIARLKGLLDTPSIDNFLDGVRLEAAHQTERWSVAHDEGKAAQDWFWLLGFLAGKALQSALRGEHEKALHHTVSSAAALMNWHLHLKGERTAMRPGIAEPGIGS